MIKEFREFLFKQNALALAVGVVIGGAIGNLVNGIVSDIIMPVIGVVLPSGEWRTAQIHLSGENALKYGDLFGRIVDFVIVAFVIFLLTRFLLERNKLPPPVSTKNCPECLELLPLAAKRCRACAVVLPAT